jgi:hypothetical protein
MAQRSQHCERLRPSGMSYTAREQAIALQKNPAKKPNWCTIAKIPLYEKRVKRTATSGQKADGSSVRYDFSS